MSDGLMTVQGSDIQDVLQRLGRQGGYSGYWITIDPHQNDFGRGSIKGFRVRYSGHDESFVKTVPNEKALLRLIVPIWRTRLAQQRKAEEAARRENKAKALKAVKLAAKALTAAKKYTHSI